MKKRIIYQITTVFLLATILISANGYAQNDPVQSEPVKNHAFGIRFGGMVSDLWFPGRTNKPVETAESVEPLKSLTFGISMVKDYKPNYFVFAEIMYERKGRGVFPVEEAQEPIMPVIGAPSPFSPGARQYFSAAAYFLFGTQKESVFYLGPGIYSAVLIRHYNIATNDFGVSTYKNTSSFGFHDYDVGLGLKAGIRHPIKDNLIVDFNFTVTSGLIPIHYKFYRNLYKDYRVFYSRKNLNFFALNKTLGGTLSLSYRF